MGRSHDGVAVCGPWVPGVSARSCPQSAGAYFETICMYFILMHFSPADVLLSSVASVAEGCKEKQKKKGERKGRPIRSV